MISYDEARQKAKELWNEVDYCTEYADAYVFSKKDDLSIGGNSPIAVMKKTGECMDFLYLEDKGYNLDVISERYI